MATIPGLRAASGLPLARYTTIRIGGPAEFLVEVSQQRGLVALLEAVARRGVRLSLLGLGSNMLMPDEGLRGVVVRLTGEFKRVRVRGEQVRAGAAVPLAQLARRMAERGLLGLETLSGFPSTLGGAVVMNAGAYGTEIKDVLVRVSAVERDGRPRRLQLADLDAGYRQTALQGTGTIVTAATLQLRSGSPKAALERIEELNRRRWGSLPSGQPNAGSIFKNPPGDYAGRLIESCRLKGVSCGQARISEKHANVIVNTGQGRAGDVLELMSMAYRAVWDTFGIRLVPEIVLAGSLREAWREVEGG